MKDRTKYTVNDISVIFNVDRETVRRWLQTKRLNGEKIGMQWFVTQDEIDRFGNERAVIIGTRKQEE